MSLIIQKFLIIMAFKFKGSLSNSKDGSSRYEGNEEIVQKIIK